MRKKRLWAVLLSAAFLANLCPGGWVLAREEAAPIEEKQTDAAEIAPLTAADTEDKPIEASESETQEKYPKDENGEYLVVENYVDKIDRIPDARLFGAWDADGNVVTESLLDYEKYPEMAEIAQAAKQGDYPGAKDAMLEYYRGIAAQYPAPEEPSMNAEEWALADALDSNFIRNSNSSIVYLGKAVVQGAMQNVDINVLDTILSIKDYPAVKILAIDKDGTRAKISAREIADEASRLIVMVNGEQRVYYPVADATIRAGAMADTVFQEDYLYAQESPTAVKTVWETDSIINDYYDPAPVDENTERAVLRFDLSDLSEDANIQSATLRIHAGLDGGTGSKTLMAFRLTNTTWTEADICWNSYEHAIACYDNEPYIRMHSLFLSGYSRRYRDELQRLLGYVTYAVDLYRYLADEEKKEAYAKKALRQYCGFLDQLGNVEELALTGFYDTYEGSKHGRTSLDVADRTESLFMSMIYLINSKWMTSEIWTSVVKYAYRTCECLESPENYHPSNNWGPLESTALIATNVIFQEFRRHDVWTELGMERLFSSTADQIGEDYGCVEVPLSYTHTDLNAAIMIQRLLEPLGMVFDFPEAAKETILGLQKYLIFASTPGLMGTRQGNGSGASVTRSLDIVRQIWEDDPLFLWVDSGGRYGAAPAFTSHRYLSNRKYIMRSGWGDKDFYLHTNIDGSYHNHGHQDDLGLILSAYGRVLLPDSGYNGLDYESPEYIWLSSTRAHNTVEVNGRTQVATERLGTENDWQTNGAYDYFSGTTNQNVDADHTRNILFIRDGVWIVTDYLKPKNQKKNSYSQLWHMDPEAAPSLNPVTGEMRSNFADGTNIHVVPADYSEYTNAVKEQGYFGGGTGKLSYNEYTSYEKEGVGNVSFATVLVPETMSNQVKVTANKLSLPDVTEEEAVALELGIYGDEGSRNGSYYTVNDRTKTAQRQFGNYTTNGTMAYVEKKDGILSKVYYRNTADTEAGVVLRDELERSDILRAEQKIDALAVEYHDGIVRIYTDDEVDQTKDMRKRTELEDIGLKILVPQTIQNVYLNDEKIAFSLSDGYLTFDGNGSGETPGSSPVVTPSAGGSGHGGGGGGLTMAPSMGDGSISQPNQPTQPSQPTQPTQPTQPDMPSQTETQKDALKAELKAHWAEQEIGALIDAGIVGGGDDGLALDQAVSRAEFAAMLVRALKLEDTVGDAVFLDVPAGAWYAQSIYAAYQNGIMRGYGGYMRPEDTVTREEAAQMLSNALRHGGTEGVITEATVFTDESDVSDWAKQSVQLVCANGLMNGFPDGSFRPQAETLREQAMVMIYRLLA